MKFRLLRYIILFTLLFPATFLVYSQRFTGAVSIGLSGSQVDGDTYGGYNKAGPIAGGWVNLSVSDRSALQLELKYIQKGSRHNPNAEKNDMTFLLIKLGYIEMPLIYQYKMKTGLYLEVGPSLGVLLHSHEEIDYLEPPINTFRLLDLGVQAGIGYQLNNKFKLSLRSSNSIMSIRKVDDGVGYRRRLWDYGQYNNLLALELSYIL